MQTISQQEAEDLARSLPLDQSQSWGGAVYLVVVSIFVMWLLSRGNGARSLTFLDVERNRDTTKNRINLWLSQWGTGLGLLIYALGLTLIAWQAWQIYYR